MAQSLAIALEQAGHRVTLFADGPSALSGLARLKPAAVLLDIGLPGMDGYELAARLRKKPNLQHTLFIALSGFKRRVEAGKAHGDFDHYFVKPVDPDKLLTLIEAHARARKPDGGKRAPGAQTAKAVARAAGRRPRRTGGGNGRTAAPGRSRGEDCTLGPGSRWRRPRTTGPS